MTTGVCPYVSVDYAARGIDRIVRECAPLRLLIADNHDLIRRGVRNLFEGSVSYHVVADARDGQDALRLAAEFRPHIAIVESMLPALNGLELAYAMHHANLDTKVLLYTMDDSPDISRVLEAGSRGFVLKSDPESSLIHAVEALSMGQSHFSPSVWDAILGKILERKSSASTGRLSQRQRQVVQLVAEGWINKEIAYQLGVSAKTVEWHRQMAMRKMKVATSADLVRWAIRNNLVLA